MRALKSILLLAGVLAVPAATSAAPPRATIEVTPGYTLTQAPAKNCRREPIWGFRMSPFCKPTGICSDRVIKGYRTVCG